MNNKKRSTFSGGFGFVLAAAGSAVGLGNIWRFPYLAAKYGGGIFLLFYILLVVTFGFSLMIAENAIGRKTGKSGLCAFRELSKKWGFIGIIATLIPMIIQPYYNVIGGWVIEYATKYVTGNHQLLAQDNFFTDMLASPQRLLIYQFIFSAITTFVILRGVQKGVEKFSTILMPVLIVLAIIVAVYSITLPGAMTGVKYFFVPDFSNFSIQCVLAAMGQMFYSLSLAMGIMIVPAVFAFSGGDQSALGKGPSLMFVTLPKVFESMGMATVIGSVFFILVLLAALTSSISIMEAIVSSLCDRFGWDRNKTTICAGIGSFLFGIPPILGYNVWDKATLGGMTILDMMDFATNSILMPICALLTCIFVAYVIGVNSIHDEVRISSAFKRQKLFDIMIKYVAPVFIVAILISSILEALGIIKF